MEVPQAYGAVFIFEFVDISSSPSTNGMLTLTTNGDLPRPIFIPNGMPNTVVPCGTEKSFTNGMVNGHMPSLPDNPFTGYIIAVHRKMVSLLLGKLLLVLPVSFVRQPFSVCNIFILCSYNVLCLLL